MNISGIRPNEEFYRYNTIQQNEERSQQIQQAKLRHMSGDMTEVAAEQQNFTSYDFAQMYDPSETFEMKGRDSSLEDLDVKSAISDMKKDSVLQQYQFFVGESEEVEKRLLSVRPMEDFTL